jgi:ABC-type Zn uptake system ZnuABC Zn-binding protein ZnuA
MIGRLVKRPVLSILLLVLFATGCGSGGGSGKQVAVVATTTQAADLVHNVGGERVEVTRILVPGADPHDFEPRPSDAKNLIGAKVVFRSGGEIDGWLDQLIKSAGSGAPVVVLIDSVHRLGDDPHWWQDPRNAELAVTAIRAALIDKDPEGATGYRRRAAAYERRLRRLDRGIARCMAEVPPAQRKLVTTHDSLGYFARRYRVKVVGAVIPSLSTQAQPSGRDTERLVSQVRREGVQAIFPESPLNPRLERALAREAGVEVGDPLWGDSLGQPGTDGDTYLKAMASETAAMVKGMTGGRTRCRPNA